MTPALNGPTQASHDVDRLAATEYAVYDNPDSTRATRFGRFTTDPRFPFRHDANQLFDVRCARGEVETLLAGLDRLYEPTSLPYRKMTLHDAETRREVLPVLEELGWSCRRENIMPFEKEPSRTLNPNVKVRAVPFDDLEGHREAIAMANSGHVRSLRYRQAQDERLGGEALVGYLDDEPVGVAGWFIVDGIARFRPISTIAAYRKRGVATALIRYVQEHPAVRAADGLVIFCSDDGPLPLYEQLGFVCRCEQWSCLLKLPDYPEDSS